MDYCNNYGVHPFWPVTQRWFYGDGVFIVEPWFWMTTIPVLIVAARTRGVKIALGVLLALAFALGIITRAVPAVLLVALAVWAGGFSLLLRRLPKTLTAATGAVACLGITAVLFTTSAVAERELDATLRELFPSAATHDVIVTPLPANPMCWTALAVQTEGTRYVVRRSVVALWPSVWTASECPRGLEGHPTAPFVEVPGPSSDRVAWRGQFAADVRELRDRFERDCVTQAFLRFARAPFWIPDGPGLVLGDLRYDREPARGFAEIGSGDTAGCPENVPPWEPPRRDLLGAGSSR
jgi:inner membrane protein